MREYLLRMSHNALVLIEWGNLECLKWQRSQSLTERQAMAQELVQAATEFRLYALLALLKLKIWIVFRLDRWPLVSAPSLPALRRVFGIDALSSYNRVKQAAGGLSNRLWSK